MMKDILLLRHGQIDAPGYIGCRTDPSLSEEGRTRSEALIETILPTFSPDVVFSSPLKRCLETIGAWSREAVVCEELRELDFGVWEGLQYDEIKKRWPEDIQRWISDPLYHAPPEGEPLVKMHRRSVQWWNRYILGGAPGRYLVVTHAGPIRSLLSHLSGAGIMGHWRFSVQRGNFCRITVYEDQRIVIHHVNVREL